MAGTVVEFVGIPGAGKSYLAAGLGERLAAGGRSVTSISRPALSARHRAALVASVLVRRPRFSIRAARLLGRIGVRSMFDSVRLWANWMIALALVDEGRRRGGVTVLDQGPVQLLWSIGMRSDPAAVSACATVVGDGAGDLIVEVSVPAVIAEQRLATRRGPRPSAGELEHGLTVLGRVLTELPALARLTIGNGDPGAVDAKLAPVLAALSLPEAAPGS